MRNPELPRGEVEVVCNECSSIYQFWNHENGYEPGRTDRCPQCGAVNYQKRYSATNMPAFWGIDPEWERWHKTFRDPLNLPNREPISYSKAMAYAAVHNKATGEQVSAEDVLKEVNTRYRAVGAPTPSSESKPS